MRPIEFTEEEEALLDRYLDFYESLASGAREPTTEAQRQFVLVTKGKAGASTVHEFAYAKHMRQNAFTREVNWLASESKREAKPAPEWFGREDYRKLRGRRFADLRKRGRGD